VIPARRRFPNYLDPEQLGRQAETRYRYHSPPKREKGRLIAVGWAKDAMHRRQVLVRALQNSAPAVGREWPRSRRRHAAGTQIDRRHCPSDKQTASRSCRRAPQTPRRQAGVHLAKVVSAGLLPSPLVCAWHNVVASRCNSCNACKTTRARFDGPLIGASPPAAQTPYVSASLQAFSQRSGPSTNAPAVRKPFRLFA